ncbi:SDR family oxidoreductase [Paenibacillus zeisoli]|uniref:SDR family oxidoreductase n=1 Tax=Paenibacillus zeisoli TaxID=2496267 RepID=A0A433XHT1_9BACL|nr:SDR family oxidoreductase [Paenibacillus zeisoli]RUT33628.1 SDR family oxidoreductase [Paenibacillus zeisoli]
MIIVTGANGKLGRAVVEQLLERVPAGEIGVSVRDVVKAQNLQNLGVRVRQGNFEDSEGLLHAFEGASQVLIVSSGTLGEAGIRHHRTAIDTAKKAGAGQILYTSHMGVSPVSYFPPMIHHAATEQLLANSGAAFTSLRNGFYAASAFPLFSEAIQTGELIAPEDGPIAWTTHADLAKATAAILIEHKFEGSTPNLTAAEAIRMDDIASMASELIGRPIRRVVVSDDEYRDRLISKGTPKAAVNMLLGIFRASRNGDFAQASGTLADLIGHAPTSFREVLKESLAHQQN